MNLNSNKWYISPRSCKQTFHYFYYHLLKTTCELIGNDYSLCYTYRSDANVFSFSLRMLILSIY